VKTYKSWQGRKVRNDRGEIFIETDDAQWHSRLRDWKLNHLDDPDCPCPMPAGHVMFLNYNCSNYYTRIL